MIKKTKEISELLAGFSERFQAEDLAREFSEKHIGREDVFSAGIYVDNEKLRSIEHIPFTSFYDNFAFPWGG